MTRLIDLVELLQRYPQVTLFLELKRIMTRSLPPSAAVAQVLPVLTPIARQVVLISFSIELLKQARLQGWRRLAPVLTRWYQLRHQAVLGLDPEWLFINHLRIPLGLGQPAGRGAVGGVRVFGL